MFSTAPFVRVWAQMEGTLRVLHAPKLALVLGNGAYRTAPLKNPANDARAIASTLELLGFEVTLGVDLDRTRLNGALESYVRTLAERRAVGIFYYAGHGIQLAWRNYMLPVDAAIARVEDVREQGVDVNALMQALSERGNPLNIVILDACRDNPFGNLKGIDHKGLSQMDAPPNSLIAYATSPGNVASDGAGTNGLYTESLLAEIKVPEAKIEEVFKRVRLDVRRKSNGAQIPWESTSLLDDFWFIPPREFRRPSDAEKERRFREELRLWERIKATPMSSQGRDRVSSAWFASKDAAFPEWMHMAQAEGARGAIPERIRLLEEYLRRFPSGYFSELAQLELDRALALMGERKIAVLSERTNPYSKGWAKSDTRFSIGDKYAYRVLESISGVAIGSYTDEVAEVTASEVRYVNGKVTDLLGNPLRDRDGRRFTPHQIQPVEFELGRRWSSRWITRRPNGYWVNESEFRIVDREQITVPAGSFYAFRVEQRGVALRSGWRVDIRNWRWYAPDDVRAPVATDLRAESYVRISVAERNELVSFTQR